MTIKTINIHVCDRCGYQTESPDEWINNECGSLQVKYHGSLGSKSYNGDCGGVNINENKWLCLSCTMDFIAFMRDKS